MASDSIKTAQTTEEGGGKGKTNQAVIDQLQAPRKKRKSYVVLAIGESFDPDTTQAIQRFMRTQFPKLSFATVRTTEELIKYSSRNIVLALIDDELIERTETLKVVGKLKSLKTDGPLPTLFLTKDSKALVDIYKRELHAWQEVDEYLEITGAPRHALFTKMKSGIETRFQRRGRRYKMSIPVYFQVLDAGEKKFRGEILDFSIHGALLSSSDSDHHFTQKDQILVHIPFGKYIKGEPDIFRASARVRRVLISGDKAGVSWEYMSEDKTSAMTRLLTAIVDIKLAKSANSTRAKIARAEAEAQLTRNGATIPE